MLRPPVLALSATLALALVTLAPTARAQAPDQAESGSMEAIKAATT